MKPGQIEQIRNAAGERLPLAEDIARHIATRPRVPKFVVTYWLRTLRDAELLRLGKGAWHLVGGAERCRRLGWVEVRRPTGITANPDFDLQITPKGLDQYREGQDRVLDSVMRLLIAE
jgi:hypothetical protein